MTRETEEDPLAIDLEDAGSRHTDNFLLPDTVWFSVQDSSGVRVTPKELAVLWTREPGTLGWNLMKVDVRGRRLLKAGGMGNSVTVTLFDLKQFPATVVEQIEAEAPRARIPKHYTRGDALADMRDIGDEWTEKIIDLKAGETAWSPLSDKWVFGGPGRVIYKNHPSGMDVLYEGTRKIYK